MQELEPTVTEFLGFAPAMPVEAIEAVLALTEE
jgi:hypothetical protein